MPYKFELFDYADVSLKHITERDAELLTELGTCTHESNEALCHANIILLASKKRPGYDPECFFVGLGNDFTDENKAELIEAGFSESSPISCGSSPRAASTTSGSTTMAMKSRAPERFE